MHFLYEVVQKLKFPNNSIDSYGIIIYTHYVIVRFLLITLILLSFFSCKQKKTPVSAEQNSDAVEMTETQVINKEPHAAENSQTNEMREDYAKALKVWTLASEIPFYEDGIFNIVYGNNRFVATGHLRINLAYSDDGDKWTAVDNIFNKRGTYAIAYGGGRFVAAANGEKIAYSDDGETWTLVEQDRSIGSCSIHGIVYGNGRFVAVGSMYEGDYGIIAYSSNGETWTVAEDGGLGIEYFQCIAYGNGQFIAGATDGKAAYSNNGETWTVIPGSPFLNRDIRIIAYGNGRFVAFSAYFQGRDPLLAYSDDCINWTAVSNDITERFYFYNIVYANGIFIGVFHSARMVYSFDGETWYPDGNGFVIGPLAGEGDMLRGIAYGNGRFVIGRGNGAPNTSGIAWCEMPELAIKNSDDMAK
jgi:hypothetical protein